MALRRTIVAVAACGAVSCSDSPTRVAEPTALDVAVAPSATVPNRVAFPVQPAIQLEDAGGNPVARAGVVVSVAISAGGGTLAGVTLATADANGRATFTGLAIQGLVGARTLTYSAAGLASVTTTVTTTGGAAATLEQHAGTAQTEAENIALPVSPAVRARDADGNPSPGAQVTFAVTGGGGSITGAVQATGADGIATVGSWIMGSQGPQALEASTPGVATPLAFSATSVRVPVASVTVTAPSTTALVVGSTRQYSAVTRDSVGRVLANRAISWNVSPAATVASVSSSGLVLASLPGTADVIAESETKSGSAPVSVVAPTLPYVTNPLFSGHVGANVTNAPAGFRYGFGYYSSVHQLNAVHHASSQLGWGSWLIPDNLDFTQPLCPVGTFARDNWAAERGPVFRDVYQTIEGGVGRWVTERFPYAISKFRVNGTPDCYDNQVASSAWHFYGTLLPDEKLGIAVLSNRLLVPPDGITFTAAPGVFGNAWIALPLVPASTAPSGLAVGDQSWTLFVRASNFSGPTVFYTPETWTRVHITDQTAAGRGHDVRPSAHGNGAMEIGQLGFFEGVGPDGTHYRRVPRLAFPMEDATNTVLLRDLRYFSKQAIWDAFTAWIDNGTVATTFNNAGISTATVSGSSFGVRFGTETAQYPAEFVVGAVGTSGGGTALGMTWSPGSGFEPGVYPEYYKQTGATWTAIPASQVPRTTWLIDQQFPQHQGSTYPSVNTNAPAPFRSDRWASQRLAAMLADGSTVEYVWYKFVEQPAIARLGLPEAVLTKLQAFVESLHENSGTTGVSIPAPTSGTLTTIDPALIVTPPAGLEKGYVPVVVRQY